MPDCLGGGIGASSPVWMRDYSQPNDREPKNPKAKSMIGERMHEISVLVPFLLLMDLQMLMPMLIHSTTKSNRLVGKTIHQQMHHRRGTEGIRSRRPTYGHGSHTPKQNQFGIRWKSLANRRGCIQRSYGRLSRGIRNYSSRWRE